jgi:transmembrane sensor
MTEHDADGGNRRLIAWFRTFRPADEPHFDADSAWKRFARQHSAPRVRPVPVVRRVAPWAAAAALVLAVGSTLIVRQRASMSTSAARRVQFADGSLMTLRGGSVRTSANTREVFLDGEASFVVKHDDAHPFRVATSHGVLVDIGTRFDVRAYSADSAFLVTVSEGAVAFTRGTDAPLTLRAGDALAELENVELQHALDVLGRAFHVTVVADDAQLTHRRVTARLHDRDIGSMLEALGVAIGARVDKTSDGYHLRSGGTQQ